MRGRCTGRVGNEVESVDDEESEGAAETEEARRVEDTRGRNRVMWGV